MEEVQRRFSLVLCVSTMSRAASSSVLLRVDGDDVTLLPRLLRVHEDDVGWCTKPLTLPRTLAGKRMHI